MTIQRLGQMKGTNLEDLKDWAIAAKRWMYATRSGYADGRLEMSIRRHVRLGKLGQEGVTVSRPIQDWEKAKVAGIDRVEKLGDRLLPGFHQGLLLFYPEGSFIKVHRDAPAYISGAASVNIQAPTGFNISGCQRNDNLTQHVLYPGEAIAFDNKQPHSTTPAISDRWCLCFFKLKPEVLAQEKAQQLALF